MFLFFLFVHIYEQCITQSILNSVSRGVEQTIVSFLRLGTTLQFRCRRRSHQAPFSFSLLATSPSFYLIVVWAHCALVIVYHFNKTMDPYSFKCLRITAGSNAPVPECGGSAFPVKRTCLVAARRTIGAEWECDAGKAMLGKGKGNNRSSITNYGGVDTYGSLKCFSEDDWW